MILRKLADIALWRTRAGRTRPQVIPAEGKVDIDAGEPVDVNTKILVPVTDAPDETNFREIEHRELKECWFAISL